MISGSLQEIFVEQLRDLLDAEKQLVRALPKMARSASDEELETAFRDHLEVTKNQVQRLEQCFAMLDQRARSKPCKGMKGIVDEGQEVMQEHSGKAGMLDAGLIGSGRRVEHYEIACYEDARSMAQQLGIRDAANLLQETLREEIEMDRRLAQVSKRLLKEMSRQEKAVPEKKPAARAQGRAAGRQAASRTRGAKKAASRGRGGARAKRAGAGQGEHGARITTDHEEIRQWAEERDARPACVRGTGGAEDTGMIRLDFPGYTGEESLQPISWDDWFDKFERNNLALLHQDVTASGEKSNFNKIIGRETGAHGRGRHAGRPERARAAR